MKKLCKPVTILLALIVLLGGAFALRFFSYILSDYRDVTEGVYWTGSDTGGYYSKVSKSELVYAHYDNKANTMEISVRFLGFFQPENRIYEWTVPVDPSSDIDPYRESFWTERIEAVKNDRRAAWVLKDGR